MTTTTTTTTDAFLPLLPSNTFHRYHHDKDTILHDNPPDYFTLPSLSIDWSNKNNNNNNTKFLSPAAQTILAHQGNCSLPIAEFRFRNRFGLGSDLLLWPAAVCKAMERRQRVLTAAYDWIYRDAVACRSSSRGTHNNSDNNLALVCYFAAAEGTCAGDDLVFHNNNNTTTTNTTAISKLYKGRGNIGFEENNNNICPNTLSALGGQEAFSDAALQVLLAHPTPLVIQHARQQVQLVFGPTGAPRYNLYCVHIRWGDKGDEMDLVPMQAYIRAVYALEEEEEKAARHRHDDSTTTTTTNIYLACEDPVAVQAFVNLAPPHWNIYPEAYFQQFVALRRDEYNGHAHMAQQYAGAPGLQALASLLVAAEATSFVLTTRSNWSRLIDTMRRVVVQPRRDTTRLVDLRPYDNDKAIHTEGLSEQVVENLVKEINEIVSL